MGLVDINKQFERQEEGRFEQSVVKLLLTHYNLASHKSELIANARQETGEPALTLRQFYLKFPRFPLYLHARILRNLRDDHTVAALLQNFDGLRIYGAYASFREELVPADCSSRYLGLVLKWPYLNKPAVLHNMGASTERGSLFVFRGKLESLCLEPLPSLLSGLSWDPSDE